MKKIGVLLAVIIALFLAVFFSQKHTAADCYMEGYCLCEHGKYEGAIVDLTRR
jgi:hypothetical protein